MAKPYRKTSRIEPCKNLKCVSDIYHMGKCREWVDNKLDEDIDTEMVSLVAMIEEIYPSGGI